MTMASTCDSRNYYKKMLELQEKLRKSEEERIRLEERFKLLAQESRSRHDECMNRLRLRYIEYLEEQRTRDERNHKLLGALDKVDYNLASMTAKTRRLNGLRKQYEAYLLRASGRGQQNTPATVVNSTVDSGVVTQVEEDDKIFRQRLNGEQQSRLSRDLLLPNRPSTRDEIRSNAIQRKENFRKEFETPSPISYRDGRMFERGELPVSHLRSSVTSTRRNLFPSGDSTSLKDVTPLSQQFSPLDKRLSSRYYNANDRFGNPGMLTSPLQSFDRPNTSVGNIWHRIDGRSGIAENPVERIHFNDDRIRTTRVLENELDRYIENIRSLHRADVDDYDEFEHDHEQNTSGDLLNVTLSDEADARNELLNENKHLARDRVPSRETRYPAEVEGVLSLASDLASRTLVDTNEANGRESVKSKGSLENDVPRSNEVFPAPLQSSGNAIDRELGELVSKQVDIVNGRDLFMGKVSDTDLKDFYVAEELEPWDLSRVEREVREMQIDVNEKVSDNDAVAENEKVSVMEVEDENEVDALIADEKLPLESPEASQCLNEDEFIVKKDPCSAEKDSIKNTNAFDNNAAYEANKNLHDVREEEQDDQCEQWNNEESHNQSASVEKECVENLNAGKDHSGEQSDHMNTKYDAQVQDVADGEMHENYLPEQSYVQEGGQEGSGGVSYDQSNPDYAYAYDQQYPDANYENDPNQQYGNYPDESYNQNPSEFYGNYQNDQNQYYSNDPNQQYENNENQGYEGDVNQQCENDTNQQYESNENQSYENDVNQDYEIVPSEHYVEQPYQHDSLQVENNQYVSYENNQGQSYENDQNRAHEYDSHQASDSNVNENHDNSEEPMSQDQNQELDASENIVTEAQGSQKEETIEESQHIESAPPDAGVVLSTQSQDVQDKSEKVSGDEKTAKETPVDAESKSDESNVPKKKKDVIQAILDSDTESTIERNVSNTESDFDFN